MTAARSKLLPAAEALVLAVIVAGQALLLRRFIPTDTFYDEGVYLVSLDAMRHGQELGTQIFTAQPPGWYHLLDAVASVFGNSTEGVRRGLVAVMCGGVIAAWGAGRALGGRGAGLLAAALLVIAFPLPLYASRVLSDPSSLAIVLAAVALAALAPGRGALVAAAASGGAFAAATSVKLYCVVALPALAVLLSRTDAARRLAAFAAGAVVVTGVFVLVHLSALGSLWDGTVSYHGVGRVQGDLDNVDAVLGAFNVRMPFTWLTAFAAVATVAALVRRRADAAALLWVWPALAVALLLWHHPLLEHHLSLLAVALVLPVALTLAGAGPLLPARARTFAAAALVLVIAAGYLQLSRRLDSEVRPEEAANVWAAQELHRVSQRDDIVVSDVPIAAYLADRRVPGELVDTAMLRIDTGSLTPESILHVIDTRCVTAVVAGRVFTVLPGFGDRLAERFEQTTRHLGVSVYSRPRTPC